MNNKRQELRRVPMVFSDALGTIFFDGDKYAIELEEDIKLLHDNGGLFVINTTATPSSSLSRKAKELGADYLITAAGAFIEDLSINKIIIGNFWSQKMYTTLRELAQKYYMLFIIHTSQGMYIDSDMDTAYSFFNDHRSIHRNFYTLEDYHWEIFPMQVALYTTAHSIDDIKNIFGFTGYEIRQTSEHMFGLNMPIPDKGVGLTRLCWELSVDHRSVMAVGDSVPDQFMYSRTPYSYSIANSFIPTLAKFFTSTPEQNGVGEAIRDYLYRAFAIVPKRTV